MNTSASLDKFGPAFVAFQAEIANPEKTANNPFFDSKYIQLPTLLAYVRPVLAAHGLSVFQSTATREDGRTGVRTMVLHKSGQFIESDPVYLPILQHRKKGDPPEETAQGAGSACTYAARYSLCAALGIAGDDDDGNAASGPPPARQPARQGSGGQRAVNPPSDGAGPLRGDFPAKVVSGKDVKDNTLIVLDLELTAGRGQGTIMALFLKKAEGKGLNYTCSKAQALLKRPVSTDDVFHLMAADFAGCECWVTIGDNETFPIDNVHAERPQRDGDFDEIPF